MGGSKRGLCPTFTSSTLMTKTKFFGNGRSNKYLRRKYKELRKKLGKAKKLNAIKRINDKESRIMKDINHSRGSCLSYS